MKRSILVLLLFGLITSVHAYHPDNLEEIYWYEGYDAQNGSYVVHVYTLAQSPTTMVATPIQTRDEFYNCRDTLKNIPCHNLTRADLVNILNLRKQTNEYQIITRFTQKTNSPLFSKDTNGNGIPEFRELIAGGEPLYWSDSGNGYQFYVNGQMLVCNSDTNWQNVAFSQVPESVTQQYPDENHNGIPDVVDAAIAAGGGAMSDGGNISVTVENKTINVQVDNTEVLDALQTISNKLNNLNVDNTEVLQAIQTLSTKLDASPGLGSGGHCDALELKPYIQSIGDSLDVINENQGALIQTTRSTNKLLALLLGVFYEGLDWRAAGFTGDFPSDEDDPVLKGGFGGGAGTADKPIVVTVANMGDVVTWLQEINASLVFSHDMFQSMINNQTDILAHLRDVQQPTLTSIKENTHSTVLKLNELINLLGNSHNQLGGDEFEKEEAHDNTDEMSEAVRSKKNEFEEEDKAAEEEKGQILDHDNRSGSSLSTRFKERLFQLFHIDLESAKNVGQEQNFVTVELDSRPLANHFGVNHGLYARFDLPLTTDRHSDYTLNGNVTAVAPYSKFNSILGTLLPILRGVLLFIIGWLFVSSMFGLFHDAWSY